MLETADMKRIRQRVDAVRAAAAATWIYRHNDLVLRVDLILNEQDVQLLWHLENLGGPFPGGMHVMMDSQLELHCDGKLVATVPVMKNMRPRSGLEAFFRQRGALMPMYPVSSRLALPAGRYDVRFTGTTHDVTLFTKFIESMGDCYHFECCLPAYRAAEKMLLETGLITPEVDRLATRIGIIHKGRLIEEFDAAKLDELRSRRLEIKTRNLVAAESTLARAGFAVKTNGNTIVLTETRAVDAPEEVAALLVHAGTPPSRLAVEQEDLENYFLRFTGEKV